jgi:hypothetical protein
MKKQEAKLQLYTKPRVLHRTKKLKGHTTQQKTKGNPMSCMPPLTVLLLVELLLLVVMITTQLW